MTPIEIDHKVFRPLLLRSMILPGTVLVVLAAGLLWQIHRLLVLEGWVDHTDQVIACANHAQQLMTDRESAYRAYLIGGSPIFLDPFRNASDQLVPALARLESLATDNPSQLERVKAIEQAEAELARFSAQEMELKEKGGDYIASINKGRGKFLMDAMRQRFLEFLSVENTLRAQQVETAGTETRNTVAGGITIAVLLSLLVGLYSKRVLERLSRNYRHALETAHQKTSELRESSQRFYTVLNSIGDAVIATDHRGWITFMNSVSEQLTGWRAADAVQRPLMDVFRIIDESTRRPGEDAVTRVLHSGTTVESHQRTILVSKNGGEIPIDDSAAPIRDEAGKITGVVLIYRDLSQRRRAEEEQARMAQQIEQVLQSTDEGIYVIDAESRCLLVNRAAAAILGYSREEMLGKNVHERMHARHADGSFYSAEACPIHRVLHTNEGCRVVDEVFWRKDGTPVPVEYSCYPMLQNGRVWGAVVTFADITARRLREQALIQSEKLAATGQMASAMAHEINNPLQAVANLVSLLTLHRELDDVGRSYATLAQQELGRVVRIVQQTLGLYHEHTSKIDVDAVQIADEVLEFYRHQFRQHRVSIERAYKLNGTVTGFPSEFRQLFSNLVLNSLDASQPNGKLRVKIWEGRAWSDSQHGVRIIVADNGRGIAPEHRRKIFEPFFSTKNQKATGLGLWVVHSIVEKQGGAIRVRSSNREGRSYTCVSIFIPAATAALSTSPASMAQIA